MFKSWSRPQIKDALRFQKILRIGILCLKLMLSTCSVPTEKSLNEDEFLKPSKFGKHIIRNIRNRNTTAVDKLFQKCLELHSILIAVMLGTFFFGFVACNARCEL